MKIIGIDGGGTKTVAVLANKDKVLKRVTGGSSSPRNIGVEKTTSTLKKLIEGLGQADHVLIGLPAVYEQPHYGQEVTERLIKELPYLKDKLTVVSDQIVAFRSGTQEKNGVLLIAGTGSVAHGWWNNKEAHSSGWGWLTDEGSAFWIGQQAIQAVFKDIDGRGELTKIKNVALLELGIEEKDLVNHIYNNDPKKIAAQFSSFCDQANDPTAQKILTEASQELLTSFRVIVNRLELENKSFPLVLVGGVFNSSFLLNEFKRGALDIAPQANIIRPDDDPVLGAVRLALEQ